VWAKTKCAICVVGCFSSEWQREFAHKLKFRLKIVFNLNDSPTALPRGFRFTSPLERSELPFLAVLGEVKYKISVLASKAKMKSAKYFYGSA